MGLTREAVGGAGFALFSTVVEFYTRSTILYGVAPLATPLVPTPSSPPRAAPVESAENHAGDASGVRAAFLEALSVNQGGARQPCICLLSRKPPSLTATERERHGMGINQAAAFFAQSQRRSRPLCHGPQLFDFSHESCRLSCLSMERAAMSSRAEARASAKRK